MEVNHQKIQNGRRPKKLKLEEVKKCKKRKMTKKIKMEDNPEKFKWKTTNRNYYQKNLTPKFQNSTTTTKSNRKQQPNSTTTYFNNNNLIQQLNRI